jgi:hypothetical protein
MVVKSKLTKSQTHTAIAEPPAPLEEAVEHEEKRPAMTQVVEVVEEEVQPPPSPPPQTQSVEEPAVVQPTVQEEEKRKEVVDEIFQKSEASPRMMPEISMHTKRRSTPIYLWAIGTIVACVVIGVALLFATGKSGGLPSVVVIPTPTATPASEVSPTPTASTSGELKRSVITIQVLNGGGKAGAASKMKEFLEDKGYTVSGTGNAESYTYDKTEILVKASQKAYLPTLEADLKASYTLGTSAATLAESSSYDAQVIVGKE